MTLLASVRRHSIRVQHHLHRWSICGTDGGQLLNDAFPRSDISMSRSSSCSSASSDSALSTESATPASVGPFTVVLLGDNGVGKSALASIFAGASDSMGSECELYGGEIFEQTITVDGERASVTLLDTWDSQDEGSWTQQRCLQTGDAFIIVYAITDRSSFLRASDLRVQLRREREVDRTPIILVGNKCDLVRCREVSISEGRSSAAVFDCKFIETSAAMQHNVWPLFEGIIRQLRLRRDSMETLSSHSSLQKRRESLPKKAKRFINRMVAKKNKQAAFKLKSKSCHDLMSL
ncbi:GTP-binding protein GEM [Danio rerio]|uniref:GTP-binding protein n=1 Tax=Danio rerio TaxID=7955 RepID=Q0P4E7_DANRE|nr:GTP-binding protein GEM [Danio rerio]AAI22114.1 GTP binding protein overexpressed in skeletal muscle [Danio rerio]AIJ28971.1 Gem [Danio rerio]|eukprot:NP_001039314.1 GTP-binding protein GEM [Danio rerio]